MSNRTSNKKIKQAVCDSLDSTSQECDSRFRHVYMDSDFYLVCFDSLNFIPSGFNRVSIAADQMKGDA